MNRSLKEISEGKTPLTQRLYRIAPLFAFLFSLLTFPSVLPWMVAFWLVVHCYLAFQNRPGWTPLAICLIILILKTVPRTPIILLFGGVLAFAIFCRLKQDQLPRLLKWRWFSSLIVSVAWMGLLFHWQQIETCNHPNKLDRSRPVVCVGDSLTDGLLPDHGYPAPLRSMIGMPVINLGISGISTSQGLGLMQRALDHNPQVVVIELGGHDFLKGRSRDATKANLIKMIDQCRDAGADVILMEIPRGFMFDPFASLEREIAYEKDVQLVSDTWLRQIVLLSPVAPPGKWYPAMRLSDDGIHSNPKGSHAIAVRVADAIEAMYGNTRSGDTGTDDNGPTEPSTTIESPIDASETNAFVK